jgi:hypothetical protein
MFVRVSISDFAGKSSVSRLPGKHRVTVGADRGYDTADFVRELLDRNTTRQVAQGTKNRRSSIGRRPG